MRKSEALGTRAAGLLVAGSIAIPAAFFGFTAWLGYEARHAEFLKRVDWTARLMQEHAFRLVQGYVDRLRLAEKQSAQLDWPAIRRSRELHAFLRSIATSGQVSGIVTLVDPHGRIAASSTSYPAVPVDISDRDHFRALARGQQFAIGEPVTTRRSGVEGVPIGIRRGAAGGPFSGAVIAVLPTSLFQKFYTEALQGPTDVATLVRADGQMLIRAPPLDGRLIRIRHGLPEAIAIDPEAGTYSVRSAADGVVRIYGYRKLPGSPLYVTYGGDEARLWEAWRGDLVVRAVFSFGASLLLLGITILYIRQERLRREALSAMAKETAGRAKAEAALNHAERLDVLGRIAGGVAHDFNNLLSVITSAVALARRRVGEPGWERFLDAAADAALRGADLTRQLLVFARQGQLRPKPLDVGTPLQTLGEGLLRQSLRGDIELEVDIEPDLWPVFVDQGQLELAVLNLGLNARDAMETGGRVRVRARNVDLADASDSPIGKAGQFVAIAVSDTGCGMPPEDIDKALEPFYTTKAPGKGTGLGLSMVHGFVSQSGGGVTIDSEVGAGTTVTIFLPRTMQTPAREADSGAMQKLPRGSGSVLLVEDDRDVAAATMALLQEIGYATHHASMAQEALDVLRREGAEIDAVVSDVVMPGGMTGVDLAHRIRREYPSIAVLLITGYSEAAERARGEGITLLRKPFQPHELAEALSEQMAARNEAAPAGS